MKLDYLQALKRVDEARGAWVLHGQEPLLEQNLIDAFRSSWQKQDIERQRYDISSVADWKTVFNALNSLSLFSTQLAIEVHGNIKPDASSLKLLKSYLQQDSDNLLLVVMPKQDASSLKTSFFQVIDANGVNVSLVANYPKDRQQILGIEAEKLGIRLANDAWQWLEQHHEHNLLAAKNSLMRVSDTFAEIDVDKTALSTAAQDLRRKTHETIQKVGDDIERRHAFNTAIAALMELLNANNKFEAQDDNDVAVARESITTLLTLLAPFAPHLSQTLLAEFGIELNSTLFPAVDESALTRNTQTIVVQVNGKLRGKLEVSVDASKDDILAQAKALPEVQQFLTGPTKKEIVVPNKLVNLVV